MEQSGNIELRETSRYLEEELYSVEQSSRTNLDREELHIANPAMDLERSGYGDPYSTPFESSHAPPRSDNFYSWGEMSHALCKYDGSSELRDSYFAPCSDDDKEIVPMSEDDSRTFYLNKPNLRGWTIQSE
jgi:hypothetical protein